MTKKELQNIIESGWDDRRRLRAERREAHSALTKAWKLKMQAIENKVLSICAIKQRTFRIRNKE